MRVGRPDSGSGRGPINGLFNTARNSPRPFYGLSAVLRVEGELTPALSIEDGEGDEGGNVTFTVALSPMAAADVTATWTASIQSVDTAVLADDLEMTTGTLTVKAGEPTGTFTVPTAQDNTDEENETFTVTLSGASENALIAEATAQGTINDDDEPPVLSVTAVDLEVIEGESATFTVTLVPASGKRVTVFAISDTDASLGHTATGGKDYSIYEDVLTFEPGEISKTVTLATTDDELDEADEETFGLSVSFPANATLEGGVLVHSLTATVTISDNDDLPTLSVADVSAAEGDGLTFTVTLSAVSGRDVTVDWTAAAFAELSDSATSGTDFTADSGTLTFAPAGFEVFNELGDFVSYTLGEARKTFTVATTEDADEEENETFTVTLSNASNASIAEATAKGMINNDDAATLVSNTEQTSSSSASANATRNTFAVQFTTGDNANGYKLDSIGLKVSTYENVAVTVSLYSDDSGSPGSSIFTFDNPPSGITAGAVNTFTSPDDDVLTHLDAMTPYFIVVSGEIDISAGSTFDFLLAATNSDAEDTGGEDDWEIADERHSLSGTTWSTDSATLQIRVFGYPATGICGRTVVVQDIILYLLGEEGVVRTCAEVNAADLSSFTYLGWANENIGPLKSGDFAGLTNVTGIELGLNDFTTLPADLFSDMTALLSINLTAGKLTSLPDGVFSGLTALEILLLAGNDIGSLPAGLFSDLSALETLLLAGNDIGSLPAGLFSGLTALEILTLGGNPNPGDVLPLTVTVEKVGTDQARAKVLAGAPFAVDFTPTVVNGSLPSGVTKLAVAVGSVEGTAVTVTRTSGTTEAVTVDIDLTTQPSLAAGHGGYTFARATSGLPATILSVGGDTPTLPTLSVADAAGTEGGNVTFTATLSEVAAADVTATWTASIESGDTAVLADDLGTTTTGPVMVEAGELTGTFDVPTAQDATDEENETFTVTLSGVSSNAQLAADPTATGTINDDDLPVVTIAWDRNVVIENAGAADFTLTRVGLRTAALAVTVEVTQQDGRDLLPDGAAAERTVRFAAGSATAALSVALKQDDLSEAAGVLTVEVKPGTGYTVGSPASATVSVLDNDTGLPTPANLTALPGTGVGEVVLSWDAHAPHLAFARHQYRFKTDSAWGNWTDIPNSGQHSSVGGDGSNLTGYTVTGLVGGQAHTFEVRTAIPPAGGEMGLFSDSSNEDSATPRTAAVSFEAATYSVDEGGTVDVTVRLSGAPGREVTVPVTATAGGGATAQGETGADWSGVPQTVTFGATDTEQSFTLTATDDTADDDGESVALSFGTLPSGVTAGTPSAATVTIVDADEGNAAPAFSSLATFDAAENQTAAGTVLARDSDTEDNIEGYAITGGADEAFFSIGATDGALTFDDAPNFEDAKDADTDNEYEVEVQATSGTGTRVKTATQAITVTVTDVTTEAPGQPAAPDVSAASVSSLTVSWSAPANAGPAITDYDVQYREGTSGSWSNGNHTGTATTATLSGLSENTSYQVQVRATNDEGTGSWSDSGSGSTMPPDPPAGFMASHNNEQVTLTWNAPDAGADITRHEYRFKTTGDYPDGWTMIDDSALGGAHEDWVVVMSLTNDVAYTFQLRAVNAAGASTEVEADPVTPRSGVCGRTEQVRDAIVAAIDGVSDCADVMTAQLTGVTYLGIPNMGIRSLQSDDFSGLTALTGIRLDGNELSSLPDDPFTGLTALRTLYLHDNELSSLPAGVFTGLTALEEIQLHDNELSSLPAGVFTGLTALEEIQLQNNELGSLPAGVFTGLTALWDLRLQNNKLGSLPAGAFTGLTALQRIQLQNNELSSLPDDPFTGLTALWLLYLQNNELSSLPDDVFTGLTALQEIRLQNNKLGSLPAGAFTGLTALKHLWLQNNELSSLPAGVFTGLTTLIILTLSDNELSSLPADPFTDLTALKHLWLANNKLSSLPADPFTGLTALEHLWLANNKLSSLPADPFTGLTALEHLWLADNELSSLPDDVFSDLTALEKLYLEENELSSLPAGVFSDLTALIELHLEENELSSLPAGAFTGLTKLDSLQLQGNTEDPLPLTVTLEKVGADQVRAEVLTGAPFAVDIPVTVANGALDGGATELGVAAGSVEGTPVTVTRTAGTTTAVTADIDLTNQPSLPSGHDGYSFARAASGLPKEIFPDATNAAPTFSSSAEFDAAENQTAAGTVLAADSDTGDDITGYEITGGADQALFEIGATSGALTFKTAPNFEDAKDIVSVDPANAAGNNQYVVVVTATSGTGTRVKTAEQTITVTVTDVTTEAPGKPAAPTVSAASTTSLSVSWTAPANAGPAITDYDYRHRTTSPEGTWTEVTGTTITTLSATIGSLAENTSYDVQVRATNAEGTGDWSDSGTGKTAEAANAAPAFSSDDAFDAAENQTTAGTVVAADSDADDNVTGYALTGGADQSFFSIGASSGALTFDSAPNFEDAKDQGSNNTYVVVVTATSGMGTRVKTATQTITVTVTDVDTEAPGQPAAPTVAAASTTSLSVSWSAPANAGPAITDYDYRHRTTSPEGTWTEVTGTTITTLSATITGLSENTSYDVQVRATNAEGTGDWSDSGTGKTAEAANAAPAFSSDAAFDAAENQTTAGTVLATDGDAGDDVTGYEITGGADQTFFSIGATDGALTFDAAPNYEDAKDQGSNNTYVVEVTATSGMGTREKTATQTITVTVTDDNTEAPGQPAAPAVSASSATSLSVNWSAPTNAGPAITDYDVQYRAGNSGDWSDAGHAGTAVTATLTGLSENTSYQVQVRATNAEGTGDWSDAGSGTTDANAAPSFSSSATFDAAENQTTAGAVLATDSDAGDDVTGYEITGGADQTFFSIGATDGALTFDAAPNYEDAKDQGSNNTYVVEVTATSGMGTREKTATQTITVTVTDVDTEAPGKPGAPTVEAASVTSLSVNWSAPTNAGPAITDYDVQYRAGNSGGWSDAGHTGTAVTATLTGLSENTSYQVQVRATNAEGTGSWSDSGSGTTDANAAPSFSSSATFDAAENQTTAGTVLATDSDTGDDVTGYEITDGADQTFFSIGATDGALTFDAAPNYEDAKDQGGNNTYVVVVTATSGTGTREKTATQTITVTVTDVDTEAPGKPGAPTVSAASVSSLSVNWSAPDNAGPAITDYDVQYRAGNSGGWSDGGHTGTAVTATLTGLSENTSYQVQVRATNAEGTGSWSDSGSGTTDANAAPSFSSSATFDAAENQTTVGTVLATDSDAGDNITGYAITGGADQGFFLIGSTSGALTFDAAPNYEDAKDQGSNNTYVVEVTATSGTGTRVKTATQTITVTVTDVDTEAPGKPGAPTVSAASVSSLSVNWSAPDNAGPAITDYDVQYRAGNSGGWSDGGHAGTAVTATLTGLSENTSYQVQVRATNAEGTGDWSDSGSGTTDANAAPSFSSSATISVDENATAVVTVVATDDDAGDDITGYEITGGADRSFFSIGASSGALTFDAAPNFEDAKDQGSNNTYVVVVTATSGTGTREKTATQTITVTVTDEDEAPGQPAAPDVSAASATSLTVSWSAPANAGPAITDYDVRYREGTSGSWNDGGHTGTATTATLSSLSEGTSYQVQVRATNAEGTGDWSDSGSGTTDPAVEEEDPEPINQPSEIWAYWTDSETKGSNLQEGCASTEPFRAFWNPPKSNGSFKVADEWEAKLTPENGASNVNFTIPNTGGDPKEPELTGTVDTDGYSVLSIRVRGRFGDEGWGAWSPTTELFCMPPSSKKPLGLAPNAPNPFNPSTVISYRLATPGAVRLEIYNLLGQPVRTLVDQVQAAGAYRVRWDARDGRGVAVAAGVYLVRLHYPGGVQTQRLLYLK